MREVPKTIWVDPEIVGLGDVTSDATLAEPYYTAYMRVDQVYALLKQAREDALREAAEVAIDYGEQQYSANVVHHPQYADDAQEDGQEIARLILALITKNAE